MTRKEQNKILDNKMESKINRYKVARLNAEISAFSSGDLSKYEFLTRKDLKYKPNALDKARCQFSPLGKTFSMGLDKTAKGYQEEGVMKLSKDIRDVFRGGVIPPGPDDNNDNNYKNDYDDGSFEIIHLMIIQMMIIQMMIIHMMIIQMMKMISKNDIIIYCLNIFN